MQTSFLLISNDKAPRVMEIIRKHYYVDVISKEKAFSIEKKTLM